MKNENEISKMKMKIDNSYSKMKNMTRILLFFIENEKEYSYP